MFFASYADKTATDYVLAGFAALVLLGLVGLGLYGSATGFLQSVTYLRANEYVAVACGFIGAGCVLYLLLEFTDGVRGQGVFAICLVCGIFSVFAVIKGMPAAASNVYGKPSVVRFEVVRFEPGGKGCSRNVVASNPAYEDFVMCTRYLEPQPEVGGTIEVRGMGSSWGIVRERVTVLS